MEFEPPDPALLSSLTDIDPRVTSKEKPRNKVVKAKIRWSTAMLLEQYCWKTQWKQEELLAEIIEEGLTARGVSIAPKGLE